MDDSGGGQLPPDFFSVPAEEEDRLRRSGSKLADDCVRVDFVEFQHLFDDM